MSRRALPPLLLGLLIAAGPSDDANWKRLEAMPREQRVVLSRNLERYDALPPDERSAVRALDADIAKLDPLLQARYLGLLRRYHAWLSDLTDAQKAQLGQASSVDARLALVAKWRKAEQPANGGSKSPMVLGVSPGVLGSGRVNCRRTRSPCEVDLTGTIIRVEECPFDGALRTQVEVADDAFKSPLIIAGMFMHAHNRCSGWKD